jgi:hypothetical protein
MPDSIDPGKMTSSVDNGVLTLRRRTYRSGDFVHAIFSFFATVFAVLFLIIAISVGTLFDGPSVPIVIIVLAAYGYFGLTRLLNSRTVTVDNGRIRAKDGPMPQLIRTIDADVADVGELSVESSKRWTFPPISTYSVYRVATEAGPDLFRRLPTEDEARYVVAKVKAFNRSSGA